jgi:diguanylate cyclase (GGDEF)-like protein
VHVSRPEEARSNIDVVAQAIRTELSLRMRVDPGLLADFDVHTAAATVDRLNQLYRRYNQELGTDPQLEVVPDPRSDRRDVVGRVVRNGLAAELGVSPQLLATFSPQVAATALLRLSEMRNRLLEHERRFQVVERRDIVARVIRDGLAERLQVHPRVLGGLSPVGGAALLNRMVAEENLRREVEARVSVDELTGALRRAAGEEALERELRRSSRLEGHRLVAVFLDVDNLKEVNDTAGHAAGDRLLQEIVLVLKSRLRTYDVIIRWGGDEFVLGLPRTDLQAAERVLQDVELLFAIRTSGHQFGFGIATLQAGDTPAQLVARADEDLYRRRRERRRPI